jgi:rSAM/selenodomain-associated transferase 2/rSAM/selenodomain-associated transferase 1
MPDAARDRLIIFTRYPEPGKTKTRLIPRLGPEDAARLQRRMTEHLLDTVDRFTATYPVHVEIRYTGGTAELMRNWLGQVFTFTPQGPGGLDQRMSTTFDQAFKCGIRKAIIIGTDIPDISEDILMQAFTSLKHDDLVFGPATDGGYYLIGMHAEAYQKALPDIFTGIEWGSAAVLKKSLIIAESLDLKITLLKRLQDVDRPEDMVVWDRILDDGKQKGTFKRISVIIPTLNEAENIGNLIDHILPAENIEVIVADGGSTDDTIEQAKLRGVEIVQISSGRANQMNAGAAEANGDVLLFLHADTRLPQGFCDAIYHALNKTGIIAGAFELTVDSPKPSFRIIERAANWRARYLQTPYGDHAIFLPAKLFHRIGGYPVMPIMEDFAMVRKLRKMGRIAVLPEPVVTSPRRWLNIGIWKTFIINQLMIAGYFVGISPARLARLYKREKGL